MTTPKEPWRQREALTDLYYMEARARLLDVAAFLDRMDRATGTDDHRLRSLRSALALLSDGSPDRTRRILEAWSDPTAAPADKAETKGATGAWPKL